MGAAFAGAPTTAASSPRSVWLRELVTIALGAPVHPSRAGAGDIVLVQFVNGVQPALCMGRESYAPGRRNLVPIPTLSALEAWVI
jgi:hypothetical protein